MAIDNLPSELPKDASEDFGEQLINHVVQPLIRKNDKHRDKIINATIAKKGQLCKKFVYLQEYVR